MINMVKKVEKKAGHDLEEGETVLDVRVVQPAGTAIRQAMAAGAFASYGTAARIRMERYAAKHAREQQAEIDATGGLAVGFPTSKCFFTLTDRRVLVHSFGAMAGAPKDLLATYPLTDFAEMSAAKGKLISKLTATMADGSTVALDVFKGGGDPNGLVESFNAALAAVD